MLVDYGAFGRMRIGREHLTTWSSLALVLLQPPAHTGSSLADFSTLKMEAIRYCESLFTKDLHGATSQKKVFFNNEEVTLAVAPPRLSTKYGAQKTT
jgi:hypothetical protein